MNLDIVSSKKLLRSSLIKRRSLVSDDQKSIAESKLTEIIINDELYSSSENILCFASYGSEIPTWKLINRALKDGKNVFLPKVIGLDICFYKINSSDELISGYKGILEPDGMTPIYIKEYNNKSLLIMPGLGFDHFGNRIGYGGGYYDRFLDVNKDLVARSIGVGYSFQMIDKITTDEFDIRPGKILLVDVGE